MQETTSYRKYYDIYLRAAHSYTRYTFQLYCITVIGCFFSPDNAYGDGVTLPVSDTYNITTVTTLFHRDFLS